MSTSKFAEVHNLVAFLSKPTECEGFKQIIDFLNAHSIKYALTVNPTIYTLCIEQFWATAKVKNINREAQLHAKVDGKIVSSLKYPSGEIFSLEMKEELIVYPMSAKTTAWNEFSSTIASAVICLATNQKAINEEIDDSLERATTIATSLDAEQDRDNIAKTQSKTTPNELSSQRTDLGGGPKCHEAMRDTSAHTRVISSSDDEGLGEEDASKHGRIIDDLDADEDITLVNDQECLMLIRIYKVKKWLLNKRLLLIKSQLLMLHSNAAITVTIDDITLAKALEDLKTSKPKIRGIVIRDHEKPKRMQAEEQQELNEDEKAKLFMELLEKRRKFFAAKRTKKKRNRPPTKAQ
nr:hypothetical protein [Tanacetum cinerariifolium]